MNVAGAILVDFFIHRRFPLLGVWAGYCLGVGLWRGDVAGVEFRFCYEGLEAAEWPESDIRVLR